MKLAVLTSSRADFGIYLPLIKVLQNDKNMQLTIVAFGTHNAKEHGSTINEIKNNTNCKIDFISTPFANNNSKDIAQNIGITIQTFATYWKDNIFDKIIVLGDRYEMFAAVVAATPFNLNIVHIHAGETTLGAIDNAYRHAISLMSKTLIVSTETYAKKAKEINAEANIYNTGALSIDNLKHSNLLTKDDFFKKWNVDLQQPTILATLHPETISFEKNIEYTKIFLSVLKQLSKNYQIVLTLPNADTMGDAMKNLMLEQRKQNQKLKIFQSLGMVSYLSCMQYCSFMIGNTSSGFVEAAYFPKWVVNLGKRQEGRIITPNIINVDFNEKHILEAIAKLQNSELPKNCNIYGNGTTAAQIKNIILN